MNRDAIPEPISCDEHHGDVRVACAEMHRGERCLLHYGHAGPHAAIGGVPRGRQKSRST